MVLPNNMLGVREQINTLAGNNAAAKAIGAKRKTILFNASYADNGRVSFVESHTRMEISERGALQQTGNRGDISLSNANGMLIFKQNLNDDSEQAFVYKDTQSLRIDKDRNLSTKADGTGYKVMGLRYNNDGQLSQVLSLSSMEAINLGSIVSAPEATTEILVNGLTLDAKQEMLKGAGVIARPNKNGANSNLTFNKIIMPEITATSSLKQGDRFTFAASGTNVSKTFEYGGISISKQVNRDMYGANSASTTFNIAPIGTAPVVPPAVGIRNLITDSGLTIQIGGGAILQFQANQISNAQERKFNSLSTLKDAINTVPGLTAEITRDNRLLIAANDLDTSNEPISFANLGVSNMVEVLGLANVPAVADPAVTRFASLSVLREAVNLDGETTLLSAEKLGENLDIHALLATSSFTVTGSSTGATSFATAIGGITYPTAQGGAARGQVTVQITSPAHGLRKGDFIDFSGAGAFGAGKYMVGDVTTDTFNLAPKATAGGVAAFPPGTILGSNGTWRKIPGEGYTAFPNATVTASAGAIATITAAAHGLANGDVIYVSGIGKVNVGGATNVSIPDGYYTVAGITANTFTITGSAGAGATVIGDPVAAPFTFQKVGPTNFATAFNPTVIRTTNGSRTVQVIVPHSSYNLGDDFRLTGLLNDLPVVVNGVTIRPDNIYTVTAKGATAAPEGFEYISFEVPAADGIGGAGAADANYTAMGANFKIDDYSRSLQYLNIDPKKSIYDETYNADVDTLSLSNLDPTNEHRKKGRVFNYTTTIYDSLGVEHKVTMNFARLNKNDWAVEIAGVGDANGDFEFVANGREDGLIAAGTIGFDNNGNFASSNVPTLNITWTNDGSAPSAIDINWDDVLNGAGIKQFGGQRSVAESVKPNGHSAGTAINYEIDSNGDVYAILNNNQDPIKAFKLILAGYDNMDGMVATVDGFFIPTINSGPPKLRYAGENGAPTVINKVIQASNIDPLSTILELNAAANDFRANVAVTTIDDTLTKEAIAKISG